MLRQTTQLFIADRALSLAYEAKQFPQTSLVALAWFNLARGWAEQRSMKALTTTLLSTMQRIEYSMDDIERPCPFCGPYRGLPPSPWTSLPHGLCRRRRFTGRRS